MLCRRTEHTSGRQPTKNHRTETPHSSRSKDCQGKALQEGRQLTFEKKKMRDTRKGDSRTISTGMRRSTRVATNPKVSYEDFKDIFCSDEDVVDDESDGSVWNEMGLSDSDVSDDVGTRKVKTTIPAHRSKRVLRRKRRTKTRDADSSTEDESGTEDDGEDGDASSATSDEGNQSRKRMKMRGGSKCTDDMSGSDEDVAVSTSAKKRKKSSTQLVSSDEEGQQKRRRKRIIVASDSSDSSDEGCTNISSNTKEGTRNESMKDMDYEQDSNPCRKNISAVNDQVNCSEESSTKDATAREHIRTASTSAAVPGTSTSEDGSEGVLSDTETSSVTRLTTQSSDNGAACRNVSSRQKRIQHETGGRSSKVGRTRTPRRPELQQKQKALERLMRQRDRKKQGINKSMCESDEENEEEEGEADVGGSESEDSFIVPDDDTDEEEEAETQEDEDAVAEMVHEEKKGQFQSWVELMLCANLQVNPGEYLRTARSNRDIPDSTQTNVTELQHRLKAAMNLVFSTAWRRSFKDAVEMHPYYSNKPAFTRMNCQACGRPGHPSTQTINLSGTPYDRETFEDDDFSNYEKSFDAGCFCYERSERYHGLYHFRHRVFHYCKSQVESTLALLREEGEEDPDDDTVIDRCLSDRDWIDELFNEMEGLIEEAHQYTQDYSQPWKAAQLAFC